MTPANLTLAAIAALAAAGAVRRRGSPARDDEKRLALAYAQERMRGRGKSSFSKVPAKAEAQQIVIKVIKALGYTRDRYGSYTRPLSSGGYRKVKFTRNNTQFFRGRPGRWGKTNSLSTVEAALKYLIMIAESIGDEDATAQIGQLLETRKGASARATEKRERKRLVAQAEHIALRQAASALRDELSEGLSGREPTPQVVRRVRSQAQRRLPQVTERLAATGKSPAVAADIIRADADLFTYDRPPHHWHLDRPVYWTEDGYTALFTKSGSTPIYHLGRGASFGYVDPATLRLAMYPTGEEFVGEGHITGKVYFPQGGSPLVSVVSVASPRRGSGAGSRLLRLVSRIARGYGSDEFLVESITDEGMPFWDHMESTGRLTPSRPTATGARVRFYEVTT